VEVKAAAEAAREQYAAGKALKHQTASANSRLRRLRQHSEDESSHRNFNFALARRDDPPLPSELQREFRELVGIAEGGPNESVNRDGHFPDPESPSSSVFRRLSRQKQVDSLVEAALQTVNERDEEGRSLPEELTVDDVGRSILRRALPEDLSRIKKLLVLPAHDSDGHADTQKSSSQLTQLFSESSIILLLCRAIAPHDDPPLGCAILSLGFSMEHGRLLHLAQLASEPHLPRERFIECLQDFAAAMNCNLKEGHRPAANEKSLSSTELRSIAESYILSVDSRKTFTAFRSRLGDDIDDGTIKRVSSPLQSVQEESEVSESSVEKRSTKRSIKPSKRSRFA
jgi:hypothetical protein